MRSLQVPEMSALHTFRVSDTKALQLNNSLLEGRTRWVFFPLTELVLLHMDTTETEY